ncbi:hypothetical protein MMC28_004733 [Mycoblastus sanguinarius]|nr:hypothetical protein [Mycoblastus sanguinarius]
MPHGPGPQSGTVHHCPGAKLHAYQKMGNCRVPPTIKYCAIHQVFCPGHNWIHLNQKPCMKCAGIVDEEEAEDNRKRLARVAEEAAKRIPSRGKGLRKSKHGWR